MKIEITYKAKWRIKNNPIYVWTDCKKLVNTATGREIKRTLNGLKAGYYIDRKFVKLDDLKEYIELIPKERVIKVDPILKLFDEVYREI